MRYRTYLITLLVAAGAFVLPGEANKADAAETGSSSAPGLVAYYPFEGSAADSSGNNNHGTVYGAVLTADRFGAPNSAYHFDGQDDYIVSARPIGIVGNAPRSVTAWLRVLSFHEYMSLIYWGTQNNDAGVNGLWVSEDRLGVPHGLIFRGHYQDIYPSQPHLLSAGNWQHIAFTFDGTTGKIYVDGVLVTAQGMTLRTNDTAVSFGIDLQAEFNIEFNQFYHGDLDDVRIYNRALSQAEIEVQFGAGGWTATASPGSGSGGEVVVPTGPVNVLSLDGGDDWVRVPVLTLDNPLSYPGSGGWSLEVWAKPAARQSTAVLCGQASINDSPKDPYYLDIGNGSYSDTGGGSFKAQDNSGHVSWSGQVPPFEEVGHWVHLAGTYAPGSSKNTLRFYLNGQLKSQSESTVAIGSRASANDPFAIGSLASYGGAAGFVPFAGEIDEVRVWNRTLSQEEIQANMRNPLRGDEPGLAGYWDFNGLDAEGRVPDRSGHGNRGILMFDAHLVASDSPVGAESAPDSVRPDTTSGATAVPDTSAFRILSIADVPNDRGRQVRVTWQRHPNDRAGASPQVTQYSLWRRFDPDLPAGRAKSLVSSFGTQPPGEWTFLTIVPAKGVQTYSTVAPTLADSTAGSGVYYSVFFLTAHTQDGTVTFDCLPDSGYSVNDLRPALPAAFTGMVYGGKVRLVWQPAALDVAYCVVYRGAYSGFRAEQVRGLAVGAPWEEAYDPRERFYRLAAVGFTGERSLVTEAVEVKPWAGGEALPGDFDQDGRITLADFFLFADAIGTTAARYDLDGDGRVELDDFLLFADRFGLSLKP